MKTFTSRCPPWRAALLVGLLAAHAAAAPVSDPTRPMATMLGATAEARAARPLRSGAPAVAASAAPISVAPPRLQSVRLAANPGASTALLDGRLVRLGERVGDSSVVAIDRHGITLRGPRGEQRLSLAPGIRQTASREAPPTADTLATGTLQDPKP